MKYWIIALGVIWGSVLTPPSTVQASLRVSFIFEKHHRNWTAKQARRIRMYRRRGCRVFALSRRDQRFALRALSHAFSAMNSPSFLRVVRNKRFTFTRLSGSQIIRSIQMRHRTLPVFGYDRYTNCPVGHNATAFAIHGMIFLRISYVAHVRRTNNWRRLAQTLAHEWMHGVGFGHGANGGQGSRHKRNSVPIFIGCLVKYYPRLAKGKRLCSQAHRSRYAVGRSRRYRRYHHSRRYRRPYRAPRRDRLHRGRSWLDGDGDRPQRYDNRSPFYAPLRPNRPALNDWLNGGRQLRPRRRRRQKYPKKWKPKRLNKKYIREL